MARPAARLHVSPRLRRSASRLMQATIAAILVVGVLTVNVSVVVNAALALAVTLLPAALERDYGIVLGPAVTLWLTTALLLHTVGMLGPYATVWWYDHVTHTLSAALVAGVGYAAARAVDIHEEDVYLPRQFLFVFVLLFALAAGVVWELLEFFARLVAERFAGAPVLVQYGLEDTVVDLVFDLVGAVLAAGVGTARFATLVESLRARLDARDA